MMHSTPKTQGANDFSCTSALVSIVVLNYNKKEMLEQCLTSILQLDWPSVEFIVVDNASTDGSADMVEERFPEHVRLIRRTVNSPTAGRNEGFRAARGEYILSIDNDIVVLDKTVLYKGVGLFAQFPSVGALAFKIGTLDDPGEPLPEHWWYPLPLEDWKDRFFFTDFFSEGAVLFRSCVLNTTGGYDDEFFQYFEAVDLSFRFIREGFDMLYCPVLSCAELRIRGFQTQQRTSVNYLSLRNRLWVVWKHYPLYRGVAFALGRIAVAGIRSVRYGWVDYFVRGVKEGINAPYTIRAQRRPLPKHIWRKIRAIRCGKTCPVSPLA